MKKLGSIIATPEQRTPEGTRSTAAEQPPFNHGFNTLEDKSLEGHAQGGRGATCPTCGAGKQCGWLSYLGPSGNGKTHLAKAIFSWYKNNMAPLLQRVRRQPVARDLLCGLPRPSRPDALRRLHRA